MDEYRAGYCLFCFSTTSELDQVGLEQAKPKFQTCKLFLKFSEQLKEAVTTTDEQFYIR